MFDEELYNDFDNKFDNIDEREALNEDLQANPEIIENYPVVAAY